MEKDPFRDGEKKFEGGGLGVKSINVNNSKLQSSVDNPLKIRISNNTVTGSKPMNANATSLAKSVCLPVLGSNNDKESLTL